MPSILYNSSDILSFLPHRYPFLMVDGVTALSPWQEISSYKNLTLNEEFFQGHFPGHPVLPGVLMLEAMAQTASLLVAISLKDHPADCPQGLTADSYKGALAYFASCDKVKFRRRVVPGERLDMRVKALHQGVRAWKVQAVAEVDGAKAAEAEITATFTKHPALLDL
jgi:3-hydroxyacyl-[acyl-carrier-protein] dehydratase